ncbi:WG repeat-containing protein [uncultured Winogradskyella sp.]|uniref:WG repeat-containing protein n=1 Tax=uncultured Winogradskyella sp. TaxID=395353 RepID=UPI00260D6FDC|nr:WG repeat-containing protein [uncultured Winogradskyella sp.]
MNEKWGFADSNGKLVYNAVYDSVGVFKWNKTLEKYGSMVYKGDTSAYIDKQNKSIFDSKYKNIILYYDWIIAQEVDRKLKLFDTSTQKFNDFTFDTYETESNFLVVENDGKIGAIDSKSNIIIPLIYDQIIYKVFYDSRINSEDYKTYKLNTFNFENKNGELYLDDKPLSEKNDLVLVTVINDNETKRILKPVYQKEESLDSDDDIDIEVPFSVRRSNNSLDKLSQKIDAEIVECDSAQKRCIFKRNKKYGIYNVSTKKESKLFDKVEFIYYSSILFRVTEDEKIGVIDENLKLVLPIKYNQILNDYNSNYILTATRDNLEGDRFDYKYDYYNLKTNKYIITDCEFLSGDYTRKSSENGVYYFPVSKDKYIFYVDENGIEYRKK